MKSTIGKFFFAASIAVGAPATIGVSTAEACSLLKTGVRCLTKPLQDTARDIDPTNQKGRVGGAVRGLTGQTHRLNLVNHCSQPVVAAVSYLDLSGKWQTKAWYSLSSYERARNVAESTNRIFYVYAHTPDRQLVWTGETNLNVGSTGDTYQFRKVELNPDRWVEYTYPFRC